ncbi:MAG: hypothetical protein QMB55_04410 [Propionivibrio sp.]
MNKIKSYYWYIGVPIVALIFGTVLCFELIASTVRGNPHPQINYVIFVLIAGGCAMMLQQVLRMNRDARYIEAYYDLARNRMDATQLRAQLDSQRSDARAVLEIVNDLLGKTVSPVQHAALEAELHRYKAKQSRYLILPQFMSGMMVGLGLFGTFIGLLGALAEIGKLIGAFSLATGGSDPSEAIRMLVERLTAPMQAMGVAFSASLFGVLGSLIMGVLLVAVRNCTGELVSLLDTRTTFLTDFGDEGDNAEGIREIGEALGALAEQSPILRGLATALEQSERRVRDLVNSMLQLSARIELRELSQEQILNALQNSQQNEEATLKTLRETASAMGTLAQRWATAEQVESKIHALLVNQQAQNETLQQLVVQGNQTQAQVSQRLTESLSQSRLIQDRMSEQLVSLSTTLKETSEGLRTGLGDIAGVQRRGSDQFIELIQSNFKDMAALQRREADQVANATQSGLKELAGAQRRSIDDLMREMTTSLERLAENSAHEQAGTRLVAQQIGQLNDTLGALSESNLSGLKSFVDQTQRQQQSSLREQAEAATRLARVIEDAQSAQNATLHTLGNTVSVMSRSLQDGNVTNIQLVNRLELLFQESDLRQNQVAEQLMRALNELQTSRA